jgi:hypothetical protein
MARKEIVPTYIQDLENGQFAVVSENDEDGSYFGRYINTKTGNADASRGSIRFEKDDPHVKWLNDILSVKLYGKLKQLRELIEKRNEKDFASS